MKERTHKLSIPGMKTGMSSQIPHTTEKKREYYEQLHANKFDSLGKMGKFLEKHKPQRA